MHNEEASKEEDLSMKGLSLRLLLAFIICLGFAVLFGYLAAAIQNESIESFDSVVISFVQGMETDWLTPIMKVFTWIGSWFVVAPVTIIAFILIFFVYKDRNKGFLLITVVVGTIVLNTLLKFYFKRERPEIYRILDANGFSFPSGHTMMAFSLYTIIAYIFWRNVKKPLYRVFLVVFTVFMIAIISIGRIYLGVHYPSDIVGGIIASFLWVTIMVATFRFYQKRNSTKKSPKYS